MKAKKIPKKKRAKKTTITAKDTKVQLVRPDVAVILFHAKYVQTVKSLPCSIEL